MADVLKVQSIYGSELFYEELNAQDATSGYKITSIKLTSSRSSLLRFFWLFSLLPVCMLLWCIDLNIATYQGISTLLLAVSITGGVVLHQCSNTTETVSAVGNVGMQVIGERKWWGGCGTSRFIPLSVITDVIINEAIYRQRVIFYLAVLISKDGDGEITEILPLFTSQMPRLETILKMYKTLKSTLDLS